MEPFRFKKFTVAHDRCTHKVGTDGVLLGAWVRISAGDRNILDVGTGCGVIALMLAQRSEENARIDAVEIEQQDARQAADNAQASPWKDRVKVHHTSLQNFLSEKQYDLIVSNPPYFTNSFLSDDKNRSRARHAHLLPYDDFLDHVVRMMKPSARLAVILPPTESARMKRLATTRGLSVIRTTQFRARKHKPVERILLELAFVGTTIPDDELILYAEGNNWSDAYRKLTQDFYLPAGRDR